MDAISDIKIRYFTFKFLSLLGIYNKIPQIIILNNRYLFFTVLETKSRMKVQVDSIPGKNGKNPILGCRTTIFSLCVHMEFPSVCPGERERENERDL
jgi:hypothetical protein